MPDTAKARDKNRRIRQEALREQLANGGHLQHIIDIANKLSDESQEIDAQMQARLKAAADIKLKLVNKYLGDIRQTELKNSEDGNGLVIQVLRLGDDSAAK